MANVVTDTGVRTPITGVLGFLAEGARTNLCLQSNTFTTTWTQLNAGDVYTGGQSGAPDGAATGWQIIAGGAGSTGHGPRQSITLTAASYTMWAIAKAGTAGYYLELFNGNATAFATFNLTTGVVGNVQNCTSTITALAGGWYLCTATFTGTAAAGLFDVRITNSLTVNQSYVGDGASYINVWVAQMELGAFASTYIPTTTAAVARNADILSFPAAGILDNTAGACYVEFANNYTGATFLPAGADSALVSSDGTGVPLFFANTSLYLFDGAARQLESAVTPSTSIRKVATSWGSSGASGAISGVLGNASPAAFDGNLNLGTNILIGVETVGGAGPLFGPIKTVRLYRTKPSDAQLASMTA